MSMQDARRKWAQVPQQGRVESLPFSQQNGTIGLAETSLVLVLLRKGVVRQRLDNWLGTVESEVSLLSRDLCGQQSFYGIVQSRNGDQSCHCSYFS